MKRVLNFTYLLACLLNWLVGLLAYFPACGCQFAWIIADISTKCRACCCTCIFATFICFVDCGDHKSGCCKMMIALFNMLENKLNETFFFLLLLADCVWLVMVMGNEGAKYRKRVKKFKNKCFLCSF